ncbi:MAG: hypothetical protein LBQ79_13950 [Deltaproteobacteria bacterium]|jgi:hypothetical protein|nr:hypothetical protein [Deltaproteobacteria bacterium]
MNARKRPFLLRSLMLERTCVASRRIKAVSTSNSFTGARATVSLASLGPSTEMKLFQKV